MDKKLCYFFVVPLVQAFAVISWTRPKLFIRDLIRRGERKQRDWRLVSRDWWRAVRDGREKVKDEKCTQSKLRGEAKSLCCGLL